MPVPSPKSTSKFLTQNPQGNLGVLFFCSLIFSWGEVRSYTPKTMLRPRMKSPLFASRSFVFAASLIGISISIIWARLNLTSDFYPAPYLFCDENIYLGESGSILENNDYYPRDFRAGVINYLLPLTFSWLNFSLDQQSIFFLGRLFYAVLLPAASIAVTACAVFLNTKSVSAGLITAVTFGFSPVFLSLGLYWYPDSYISLWLSFIFLCLTCLDRDYLEKKSALYFIGLLFGIGLATKATFVIVILAVVLYLRIKVIGSYRHDKDSWHKLGAIFFLTTIFLFLPGLDRNLLFVRGQFINFSVYQTGERNLFQGLDFYFSLVALSVPVLFLIFLPLVFKPLSRTPLVVLSAALVFLTIAIFAPQTQYLARNLLLVSPAIFFTVGVGYKLLLERMRLSTTRTMILSTTLCINALFAIDWLIQSQRVLVADPRSVVEESVNQEIQVVGTFGECSVVETNPRTVTQVDPDYENSLESYFFTTSSRRFVGSDFDPVSWKRPIFSGFELATKPDISLLKDYLDWEDGSIDPVPKGYLLYEYPGRHLHFYVLERQ